ncbi:hypothetical protein [Luteimonas mephitis]|uniref:hypothetical protein n=1 Tax=Luteimonas mephitis TaxID=83615 RepID=UPI0012EC151C|nr:hypothetical protein [Luteimonas mephitis]
MPASRVSITAAARRALVLAACLLLSGTGLAQEHAFDWNPRSGDAWIDSQLADINVYGARYRGAFIDELVRYHAAPRALVTELVDQRNWAPGDVYYACALAQVLGRPCRALVEAWGRSREEGWAAVAAQAGIAARPDAVQRLKQDITASYARWGRPPAEVAAPAQDESPGADGQAKAKRQSKAGG